MSRILHADDSAFSLCHGALLQSDVLFEDGTHVDEQLRHLQTIFQSLCQLDSQYTLQGCEFGYIHFKSGGPEAARSTRMVLYRPSEGGKRPRKYIGVDPLRQFETRTRIARYEARNALRLRIAEMHLEYANMVSALKRLSESVRTLQDEASGYLADATQAQHAMEKEYVSTLEELRER